MYQPQLEHLWNHARRYLGQPAPSLVRAPRVQRPTLLFAAAPPRPTEIDGELATEELEASELAEGESDRRSEDQIDAEAYIGHRHDAYLDEEDDDGVLRTDIDVLPESTNGITRGVDQVVRNNDPSV